jgi:transcriptional regulator with GAF, ATPase, and Fis domain
VNRTGYDIVHRLLLENGTVKYVNEKCKTEYDEDGTPTRSMGTVQDITERIHVDNSFCGMIGRDPAMQEVFESVSDFAAVDAPVLILGESGTGKELVASAIHKLSVRASKPFVPVNCGALPEGVIESELFGHVKGAFTGAIRDKKGRFQLADGGTLFLDEVADLPKSVQVKLLRVLQEGTFEPVGGEESVSVDVRIISAANRDLAAEVEAGNFREDLYYRTRVVPILLPPLRRRKSDIPILIQHFIEKAAGEGYRTKGILDDAVAAMMDYPWPGNIRELQSAVQYALIKSKGDSITRSHLPKEVVDHEASEAQSSARFSTQPAVLTDVVGNFDIQKQRRKKLTHQSVMQVIDQCRGNKLKAAKQLGVGRATLYRFLKTNKLES